MSRADAAASAQGAEAIRSVVDDARAANLRATIALIFAAGRSRLRKLGSGVFELKSFPGAGAHLLPQLVTASQDIWHTTTETWFDRTADLRVLLNGGAGAPDLKSGPSYGTSSLTPAVWVRGSGDWLEQEDSASTSAFGRSYRYNLERDLDIWNVELGVDFGKRATSD